MHRFLPCIGDVRLLRLLGNPVLRWPMAEKQPGPPGLRTPMTRALNDCNLRAIAHIVYSHWRSTAHGAPDPDKPAEIRISEAISSHRGYAAGSDCSCSRPNRATIVPAPTGSLRLQGSASA